MTTTTTPAPAAAESTQTVASPSAVESATAAPPAESTSSTASVLEQAVQAGIDVKLPEGFVVEPEVLDGFKATAKEMGLDSPKAQKLFDQYVALEQRRADAAAKEFAARDAKWAAELKADPAFSPQKSAETVKTLRRAIDHLGGKELADAIMSAGLGNHPVLVRGLLKLGNGLREDSVAGTTPAAGDKGAETPLKFLMYPTMKSKP